MRRTLFAIVSLAAGLSGSQALAQDLLAACGAVADSLGHKADQAVATMAFGPTALLAFMPADGGSNTDSFTCTFADGRQPDLTKLTWTKGGSSKEEALDLDAANAALAAYYADLPPEDDAPPPPDPVFADKPPEAEDDVLLGACRAIADDQGYTVPAFSSSFHSDTSVAMSRTHPDGTSGTLTCVFGGGADGGDPTLSALTWTASDNSVKDLDTAFLAPVLADYFAKRAALAAQ